ncbi:MAG: DUF4192 family protein [Bowdeniella nasicola]|nr:DUF4192 family protein [Bowdeniella nasicola]
MPNHIVALNSPDLLFQAASALPYTLGFALEGSIVIAALSLSRDGVIRAGPCARLDLEDMPRLLTDGRQALAVIVAHHPQGVMLVTFPRPGQSVSSQTDALAAQLDTFVPVLGIVQVGARVRVVTDRGEESTFTREAFGSTAAVASCIAEGRGVLPDVTALAYPEANENAADISVQTAVLPAIWDALAACGHGRPYDARALEAAPMLGTYLDDAHARDSLIADLLLAPKARPRFTVRPLPELHDILRSGPPRHPEECLGIDRILRVLAARVSPQAHPRVCALGAYVAWYSGHGALARILSDQALRTQADYTLARLIQESLAAGLLAPWRVVDRGEQRLESEPR